MTEHDNKRVVWEIVETINSKDLNTLPDYFADDVTAFLSGFDETVDKEGMLECWAGWYAPFPDLMYHMDRMVSQGDTVVVEATATGTHKGEFLGISATNKKAEAKVI
jgi:predicted ester cyclase